MGRYEVLYQCGTCTWQHRYTQPASGSGGVQGILRLLSEVSFPKPEFHQCPCCGGEVGQVTRVIGDEEALVVDPLDDIPPSQFVPGRSYYFCPPVVATGVPLGERAYGKKFPVHTFEHGVCAGFSERYHAYVFIGKPMAGKDCLESESVHYLFLMEGGAGCLVMHIQLN